jgi:hypothetical protein
MLHRGMLHRGMLHRGMLMGGGGEGGGEGGGGQVDLGHRGDAGGRAECEAHAGVDGIDASLGGRLVRVRVRVSHYPNLPLP